MTAHPTLVVSGRLDAEAKATGATRYTGDMHIEGALHAALAHSTVPHARVLHVDVTEARAVEGVVEVFTAKDLDCGLSGRRVRDMPLLAGDKVRFAGERVAVVLATTRAAAEEAAALVWVDHEELPPILDPGRALDERSPLVHARAWEYDGAVVGPHDPGNLQSEIVEGSLADTDRALEGAAFSVERVYSTPAGHQGYLEPQAWLARPRPDGTVQLWGTAKAPYRLRDMVAQCLDVDPAIISVEPTVIGGDFGGKGGLGEAPLCVLLALMTQRPVRLVLRSGEDLVATDTRHPSQIRVRLGCDPEGRLVGLSLDALLDGGAYAASKPIPSANLHGIPETAAAYRLPAWYVRSRIAYTTTVPKGHMRTPGAPQGTFALESAIDELASVAGLDPATIRRRNLLGPGDPDVHGHVWAEARGAETLDAALDAPTTVAPPPHWLTGSGIAVYARPTNPPATTSMRLQRAGGGRLLAEVPIPETGTGSHTVVRNQLASALGVDPDLVDVRQASTGELPFDPGVGASRVTVGMAAAAARLASEWLGGPGTDPVTVATEPGAKLRCCRPARSWREWRSIPRPGSCGSSNW